MSPFWKMLWAESGDGEEQRLNVNLSFEFNHRLNIEQS